eukprot:CAMPEP_0167809252 /NCGR_PEP_ID=MMETSP0111_2-20121227/23682_1 /TAXON_ID=91324 /ORGANISM="Lotharella globosa, Strain CCCM811" /LENGTH=1087 /DNA_ID=CAMNT_0007707599 /DNA_START=60 /DNA_END=3323 /DNA_ORIENTATION=+
MSFSARRGCIGIVKETYNAWERRSPLTPAHVRRLVKSGIRVLVEPSALRVFSDSDFAEAGAEISRDLSEAQAILGVKQVPEARLLPDKTYLFFSHTIKGQPENMPLLDKILQDNIRLIDYERIATDDHMRLVAFGAFAGRAGMVNCFRGLGERLLGLGFSTPFLPIGSSYMYSGLQEAKDAVKSMGEKIKHEGMPPELGPVVFVFTGRGNVSKGALEIFKLLPHRMVTPEELPALFAKNPGSTGGSSSGDSSERIREVIGCVVTTEHMVEMKSESKSFDREHYRRFPEEYRPVFHKKIAPYASVVVTGHYWDPRFPRLITTPQLHELRQSQSGNPRDSGGTGGPKRPVMVADLTCDVGGSMEFLTHTTEPHSPYYLVKARKPVHSEDTWDVVISENEGLTAGDDEFVGMMGLDILPSELPKEASESFGDALMPLIPSLLDNEGLPPELERAVIAENGALTDQYAYIAKIRHEAQRAQNSVAPTKGELARVHLEGHLFDTGLMNQALNLLESLGADFSFHDIDVKPNHLKGTEMKMEQGSDGTVAQATVVKNHSTAVLEIALEPGDHQMKSLLQSLENLTKAIPGAEASMTVVPGARPQSSAKAHAERGGRFPGESKESALKASRDSPGIREKRTVAVLGSGMVVVPGIRRLIQSGYDVIIASADTVQAEEAAVKATNGTTAHVRVEKVDVGQDDEGLHNLLHQADAVISLVPPPYHGDVVKTAIRTKTPVVTASYVSDSVRALEPEAKEAGIPVLCEMGLDPGLDHMAIRSVIDKAQQMGCGDLVSFQSTCGGLPAPECANNPLLYKFSWSPSGVLAATGAAARYRRDGKEIDLKYGTEVFEASIPSPDLFPGLSLEVGPNRNSLAYETVYGVRPGVPTFFRGTLRYAGWADAMKTALCLGLLDNNPRKGPKPVSWAHLCDALGISDESLAKIQADQGVGSSMLQWLGIEQDGGLIVDSDALGDDLDTMWSPVELFAQALWSKCQYLPGERDMALMHNQLIFGREDGNGGGTSFTSKLMVMGDGDPEGSAMARTVGITAAVGAEIILEGALDGVSGIVRPTQRAVYEPTLARIASDGIRFEEHESAV